VSETIFALSSGAPPAAIAVIRISGPDARQTLIALGGSLPQPRTASLRDLRTLQGEMLDRALVLWFPGPETATGEDLVELHLHGGRAVVMAMETTLGQLSGLRHALPGEFTRRAFANGRIDLAEAEGLADLLTAETELQRQHALSMASGSFSAQVSEWRDRVLMASAEVEAMLDFGDEDDVTGAPESFTGDLQKLRLELAGFVKAPRAEQLRDGFRVVLAGPPNSGKSSLFNRLVEHEAAITAPIAGTTRDVLTRSVSLSGVPFVFADTAGLRTHTDDVVEAIGIERAREVMEQANLVLWLGEEGEGCGSLTWEVESFADLTDSPAKTMARYRVSAVSGQGVEALRNDLVALARKALTGAATLALNTRQRSALIAAKDAISEVVGQRDLLIVAESLRSARVAFDRLLGCAATEDMLDALFGRFCIGK
jgi:tRNA modification GTPase